MSQPDPVFLGELCQGIMLDLVVCLSFYLTADGKHSKLDMEMLQVTYIPEVLLVTDGYGNFKVFGSIRISHKVTIYKRSL